MSIQTWKIESEILGSFFIVSKEVLKASMSPQYPKIKNFIIKPVPNDKNKQTGKFTIIIIFEINVKEDDQTQDLIAKIADIGRDIFSTYIDLLAFLSVNSIQIVKPLKLTYNYPGTNKYKSIVFVSRLATINPPLPLTNFSIFIKNLEQKHRIILTWLRRALQEKDIVNSIIASFIPLEILANQFPCNKRHINKCDKCGYITESRPGMRIQIENFLINELGYSDEQFIKIWNLRNDIFHGRLVITSEQIRDLNVIKRDLILAIIKGLKRLLGIASSEYPREVISEPLLIDSFVVVESTDTEKK